MINSNKRLICLLILLYLPITSIYKRYCFNVELERPLIEALSNGDSQKTALELENIADYIESSNFYLENASYHQKLTNSAKELRQLEHDRSSRTKLVREVRQSLISPKGNLEVPSNIVGHYIWGFSHKINLILQGASIISLTGGSLVFVMREEDYLLDEDMNEDM